MIKQFTQILISLMLLLTSCITQFIPQTKESQKVLVVEGLITDQPGPYIIKLSSTFPLGTRNNAKPEKGYNVLITDDLGNTYQFNEADNGTYISDSSIFKAVIGRFYALHINANSSGNNHKYESYPVEMKPVPTIDSVYYEKVEIPVYGGALIVRQEVRPRNLLSGKMINGKFRF